MKKKIYIADDNDVILLILKEYLQDEFQIAAFQNGFQLLETLQSGEIPDLIIADINMPELDGWSLINSIKVSFFYQNIPIIMLSGIEKTEEKIRFLKLGVNDYIEKPFNPEILKIKINNILKKSYGKA